MRLVSVVVPLWLTAIANVSLMSSRSWKPGQLGRRDGVDIERAAAQLVEQRRRALSGDGSGSLTDHADSA